MIFADFLMELIKNLHFLEKDFLISNLLSKQGSAGRYENN